MKTKATQFPLYSFSGSKHHCPQTYTAAFCFALHIALNQNLFNFTLLQVALCSRGVLYSGVVLKMTVLHRMLRDSVPIFWLWGFYSLSVTASGNHPQEVMLQIRSFSMYDHQVFVSFIFYHAQLHKILIFKKSI